MIERAYVQIVKQRLAEYPAVALIGPRQSGKTTLAREIGGHYFDLEQESDRVSLDLRWDSLVEGERLIILDEAQEWPELFKRLRGEIDRRRERRGRFLLLGSVSPALMKHVSESLAGRMSLVELTPFLWGELPADRRPHLWMCGGYPDGGILDGSAYPRWQRDYIQLLTARDLPTWGLAARPRLTQRFFRMLAVVHGQTLNASQLGKSLDISYKTVNTYLDYLEGAFLIRRLSPWHANLKKRLVKSPKVYWRDSGLLHALNNVPDEDALFSQPWVGASWEGFVVEQVIDAMKLAGMLFEPYFFRTTDGYELDLVLDVGGELWAVEIKLTSAPSPSDIQRLDKTADLIDARKRFLISRTTQNADNGTTFSCNLAWFLENVCA
jgi:hypothetical protein